METDALSQSLQRLVILDRPGLIDQWQTTFGIPVPKNLQIGLIARLIAWQWQFDAMAKGRGESSSAGSSVMTPSATTLTRRLQRRAKRSAAMLPLAPGSRLVREWQGTTHHVLVVEGGFEYQGTRYRSLTAIARTITGSQWSGPAFFGLKGGGPP